MKTTKIILFGLAASYLFTQSGCSTGYKSVAKPGQYTSDGYKLVWADEFNKDGAPDSTNWVYEHGFERNEELQWYQPQNAFCKNGLLVLEARSETKPNPLYEAGSTEWRKKRQNIEYTSASIKSIHKQSWQYGRFEMRGRIDVSAGMWPAWWTLGVSGRWPANGEIDMMEYYRKMLLANIACLGTNSKAEWHSTKHNTDTLGGVAWSKKFHTWRMDWDDKEIALYIDNQLLNKVALSKLDNKDGTGINPFKQPHYMLFDLAIGGQQGGSPAATVFPRRFEVDYVRVYQRIN